MQVTRATTGSRSRAPTRGWIVALLLLPSTARAGFPVQFENAAIVAPSVLHARVLSVQPVTDDVIDVSVRVVKTLAGARQPEQLTIRADHYPRSFDVNDEYLVLLSSKGTLFNRFICGTISVFPVVDGKAQGFGCDDDRDWRVEQVEGAILRSRKEQRGVCEIWETEKRTRAITITGLVSLLVVAGILVGLLIRSRRPIAT